MRWVRGQNGPRSRCPARSSLLRRPRRALARHPVPLVPSAGGPPTCRLSAHGCGGGGGGSSGLRKTCWPRLRNWTTAMRMWCSTRTMLAAARPPARRPGRCARSARPRQLRRVRARARPGPAPARPLPAPRPRGPAYPPATASCTSLLVRPADPQAPRAWLSPPFSLRSQDSSSLSAIRIPHQVASSQLPLAPLAPRPSCRYLASRSPSLV